MSREDLVSLYQQALALVFPTFFGPENLPPLEAFALGCPVIASRIPGSEDQFADAALQVDPTEPEAWVEAIQNIRQDATLRASLIAKGKGAERPVSRLMILCGDYFKLSTNFSPIVALGLPLFSCLISLTFIQSSPHYIGIPCFRVGSLAVNHSPNSMS